MEDKDALTINKGAWDLGVITTQQLWREIAALKELVFSRLDGIEKAIEVAHDDMVRVPTNVDKQVGALKDFHNEKIICLDALMKEKIGAVEKDCRDMWGQINEMRKFFMNDRNEQ